MRQFLGLDLELPLQYNYDYSQKMRFQILLGIIVVSLVVVTDMIVIE